MAGQELTQSTTIYVLIAPATYSLAAMSLQGAYTDLRAAQEAANEGAFDVLQTVLYHRQANATAVINGDADSELDTKKTETAKRDKGLNGEGATKRVSRKTAVPEGRTDSLAGQMCMLAGTLHHMDHKTFTQTVEAHGGAVTSKLAQANFIVIGTKPGKKEDEASEQNVSAINESEFFETIGADFPEPVAKKAKK